MNATCPKAPVDPLAKDSFYLAVFFLFFPIHADLISSIAAQEHRNVPVAILVSALFIGLVAIPATVSARRVFFTGRRFRGKRYLFPTFVLIAMNLIVSFLIIHSMAHAPTGQNRNKQTSVHAPVRDRLAPKAEDARTPNGTKDFGGSKLNSTPVGQPADGTMPKDPQPIH